MSLKLLESSLELVIRHLQEPLRKFINIILPMWINPIMLTKNRKIHNVDNHKLHESKELNVNKINFTIFN